MVWGYVYSIIIIGVGFLTNVLGRLNGDAYIDLLGNYNMIPSVLYCHNLGQIFQQDTLYIQLFCMVQQFTGK